MQGAAAGPAGGGGRPASWVVAPALIASAPAAAGGGRRAWRALGGLGTRGAVRGTREGAGSAGRIGSATSWRRPGGRRGSLATGRDSRGEAGRGGAAQLAPAQLLACVFWSEELAQVVVEQCRRGSRPRWVPGRRRHPGGVRAVAPNCVPTASLPLDPWLCVSVSYAVPRDVGSLAASGSRRRHPCGPRHPGRSDSTCTTLAPARRSLRASTSLSLLWNPSTRGLPS